MGYPFISQEVLLFFLMNANLTVAPFTNVAPHVYVCTLVGYADSVMINNFVGLELNHTSRIISEHYHGDE